MADLSHLPLPLAEVIQSLAGQVGVPSDQLCLVFTFIASLPLGVVHRQISSRLARHLFSILFGVSFIYLVIGGEVIHSFISSTVVYTLVRFCSVNWKTKTVFIFSMLYMSVSHIYITITNYMSWNMDFTAPQMILTVKFITFAFNCADGELLNQKKQLSPKPHLHAILESRAVRKIPSLLEYYSYIYFYPSAMIGPAMEIRPYLEFIDMSAFTSVGLTSIPGSFGATFIRIGRAFICYIGVFLAGYLPLLGYIDTAEFAQQSFFYRFMYFQMAVPLFRCKYYFAWYFTEAGCVASGCGFNPEKTKDGKMKSWKWDGVVQCNASLVETGTNMKELTDNWNMSVNNWLKHYVYLRVDPGKSLGKFIPKKTFSLVVTRLVSAFWHGFYPSYYLFFMSGVLVNEMEAAARYMFRPFIVEFDDNGKEIKNSERYPRAYLFNLIAWMCIFACGNYLGAAFAVLSGTAGIASWRAVYFYGWIFPIAIVILSKTFGSSIRGCARRKNKSQRKKVD